MPKNLLDLPTDALQHIMAACTAPTLARFQATCKDADRLVTREIDHRVKVVLSPYVNNVPRLLERLDQCSATAAASVGALVAAPEGSFPTHNLKIFATHFTSQDLVDLLVDDEGYVVVDRPSSPNAHDGPAEDDGEATSSNESDDNSDVFTNGIFKIIHLQRADRFVDVIQSRSILATLPIMNSPTTASMVLITGSSVCIPYPRLVEKNRALINPGHLPEEPRADYPDYFNRQLIRQKKRLDEHTTKYEDRGYDIRSSILEWAGEDGTSGVCEGFDELHCPQTDRWLGDPHCLTFTLGHTVDERIDHPPLRGALAPFTTLWWHGGEPCGGDCTTPDGALPTTARVVPTRLL